jgi:hypothetical protein
MPMVELVNALGARVQSGALFCFWIKYEAETADNGSSGAPWLCQPAPASIVPKTVMPCQANWHFEAIKFQASVHSVGADSTVAG